MDVLVSLASSVVLVPVVQALTNITPAVLAGGSLFFFLQDGK
jgi:hypothetical protein